MAILAWKIPWTEEPGGLQSMGSQRVRHNGATKIPSFIYHCIYVPHLLYLFVCQQTFMLLPCPGGDLVARLCPTLVSPWAVACQAPLPMGFSRKEYWSGLPFLSPGDLPNPGVEYGSPALQADSLLAEL